ncbi:MAG: 3-hydroxyacyl-CoA dehydrogenase NAD-binding domain-containing protein [Burkholderiales bacterium]
MSRPEVLVIGSGVMGRGIAAGFAAAGIACAIFSRNAAKVTGVDPRVALLDQLPQQAPLLVIESVPEEKALKFACYAAIESAYAGVPVLASNTSGIDLEALAQPLKYPGRFLGMHYFMPADVNTIVEVAPIRATDPAAVDTAVRFLEAAGRNFVRLKRAVPGLLINRLQHAILHEAYYLIDEGIATAEEIDRCAREMLAPRMCITGLIEQKDISGLDTHALAQRALVPVLHHGDQPRRALQDLYEAGHLGIKTGKGFYDWSGKDPDQVKAEAGRKLNQLLAYLKQHR